jgi:SAM-dependent methyltransferase
MIRHAVRAEFFDKLYADDPDPWGYTHSPYEKRKYAATLGALPRARVHSGLEIGCSIGVLTQLLARRCDSLLAVDMSETALDAARARCRTQRNVRFQRKRIPYEWPAGTFDLVIVSEVLYYMSSPGQRAMVLKTIRNLRAGGVALLVHWLGDTGTARTGDGASMQFIRQARRGLRIVGRKRTSRYRIDLLARVT